jgi:hypothetical protein
MGAGGVFVVASQALAVDQPSGRSSCRRKAGFAAFSVVFP